MIKFKDEQYMAPFKPTNIGSRNLKKVYSILLTNPDAVLGKLSTSISNETKFELRRDESFLNQKRTPIYIEELALSRLIEDYLDFMIPEIYKQ